MDNKTTAQHVTMRLRAALTELRTLRDELRLQIHLGEMEAREAWHELLPRVERLEHELADTGEEVADSVAEAAEKLRDRLRELRDHVRRGAHEHPAPT